MNSQNITISERDKIEMLTELLSREYLLYTKTMDAQLNMYRPDLNPNCLFFEKQFGELAEIIDNIAAAIPTTGDLAAVLQNASLSLAYLPDGEYQKHNSKGYISELLYDHVSVIGSLRRNLFRVSANKLQPGSKTYCNFLSISMNRWPVFYNCAWIL